MVSLLKSASFGACVVFLATQYYAISNFKEHVFNDHVAFPIFMVYEINHVPFTN